MKLKQHKRLETRAVRLREAETFNPSHDPARLVKHRDELLARFHEQRIALTQHGALDSKITQIAYDMRRIMPRDGGKEKAAAQLEELFKVLLGHPVLKKTHIVRSDVGHHINPLLDKVLHIVHVIGDQEGFTQHTRKKDARLNEAIIKMQDMLRKDVRRAQQQLAGKPSGSCRPRYVPPASDEANKKLAAD